MTKTEQKIIEWAGNKGIYRESTALNQALKAQEEISELLYELNCMEITKKREGETPGDIQEIMELRKKALIEAGDVMVCMVNLCWMLQSTIGESMCKAYEKIKDRKGEMKDGFFVKEKE